MSPAPKLALLAAGILAGVLAAGCRGGRQTADIELVPGGNAHQGARLIERFDCGSCHTIPGIPDADGLVAPPLIRFARWTYIAGVLPNTPPNLVRWVMNPPSVDPMTAMPALGLDRRQARDVAAYLYTLR